MANYYKEVKDSIICNTDKEQEVWYYIPESHFGSKSAIIVGEFVNLLGVFNFAIHDKNGKPVSQLKTFNYPSIFLAQPYKIDKVKDIQLTAETDKQDYRILRFKNGDKLVVSVDTPQTVENTEELFRLFVVTGNVPNTINYKDDLWRRFIDSMILNGNKFAISYQFFGVFISELCRDLNDMSKPFRLSKEKKAGKWTSYRPVSVKAAPKYTSPFVCLTSENMDDSIIAGVMMKDAKYSPMERVLTGKYSEPH